MSPDAKRRRSIAAVYLSLAFAGPPVSAGTAGAPKPPKAGDAERLISRVEGRYEVSTGGIERSLTILRHGKDSVYFQVMLVNQFGGSHSCSLSGFASYDAGAFVHKDKQEPSCRLELRPGAKELRVLDGGSCHAYCGVAAAMEAGVFPLSARRKLDAGALRKSEDYLWDLKESGQVP